MELLTYWLYRLLTAAVGALPLNVGIRIGRALGLLGYYILPGYRDIALRRWRELADVRSCEHLQEWAA